MASIGWLHLTDLHLGFPGQTGLWPTVREQFYRDLERLHTKSGPWDLVLFTGDLTQKGTKEEFDRLTETLGKLWEHLAKLGSKPALVTAPGNHDLQRPKMSPAVRALRNWHTDADLREEFWATSDNDYRAVVGEAFAAYEGFVKEHPLPEGFIVRQGTLPGDRSISLERDNLKLALVGLNSAFLQLEGGDYQGKLDLDVRQFHGVCGDDPSEWLGGHHAALLLTHHPTTWLNPRALAIFKADIAPPGRFLAHLFGHMHEGTTTSLSVSGSSLQRAVQGPSLFGLETWGGGSELRIHGYMTGRISLKDMKGTFAIWPRTLLKNKAGAWQMAPDFSFDLHEEAVIEEFKIQNIYTSMIDTSASPSLHREGLPSKSTTPSADVPAKLRDKAELARVKKQLRDYRTVGFYVTAGIWITFTFVMSFAQIAQKPWILILWFAILIKIMFALLEGTRDLLLVADSSANITGERLWVGSLAHLLLILLVISVAIIPAQALWFASTSTPNVNLIPVTCLIVESFTGMAWIFAPPLEKESYYAMPTLPAARACISYYRRPNWIRILMQFLGFFSLSYISIKIVSSVPLIVCTTIALWATNESWLGYWRHERRKLLQAG